METRKRGNWETRSDWLVRLSRFRASAFPRFRELDRISHTLQGQAAVIGEAGGGPGRTPDEVYRDTFRADGLELVLDLSGDGRADRTAHRRQGHLDADVVAGDLQVIDQPEIPDVHGNLRVKHGAQDLQDLLACEGVGVRSLVHHSPVYQRRHRRSNSHGGVRGASGSG